VEFLIDESGLATAGSYNVDDTNRREAAHLRVGEFHQFSDLHSRKSSCDPSRPECMTRAFG
jgi:hypothetical protein